MKVLIVGGGYVGLVQAAGLSDVGNDVVVMDFVKEKIDALNKGQCPIEEPGLAEMIARAQTAGRIRFVSHVEDAYIKFSPEVVFFCVGTPSAPDGSADLQYLLSAAAVAGAYAPKTSVFVVKSTVPPGSWKLVRDQLGMPAVVSNPEFLAEGRAVRDMTHPDRIVIGTTSNHCRGIMAQLYAPFVRGGNPIVFTDNTSAEIIKLAANAMLATRVSLMNEVAELCDIYGGDVEDVRRGVGADKRIGSSFLYAGIGFGGSCFLKDLRDFEHVLKPAVNLYGDTIVGAVIARNQRQRELTTHRVLNVLGFKTGAEGVFAGQKHVVGIWGIAFKPDTDDVRDAPSLDLANRLAAYGVRVRLHDPSDGARGHARSQFYNGASGSECYNVLENKEAVVLPAAEGAQPAEALLVVTEWGEYRSPDFAAIAKAGTKHVFDLRNIYDPAHVESFGLVYHGVGRGKP